MANKIVLKKSSEALKVPAAGDLDYGELALNFTDGKLYYKTASNNISSFSAASGAGTVDSVAGKTGVVTLTSSDVGLGSVDNTSDANKPVSTATQTALDTKQATLVSGTNIKTVNGTSVLGSGNIQIDGGVTSAGGYTGAVTATNLLDAIKTVDGAGSGLDADLLDGNSSAAFYLATNPSGYTTNTGTVTSIATNNGITGGTITTTGTLGLTGQALALHNLSTSGIVVRTGADTFAGRTLTASTGISISDGDGVSGNPTITNSAPDQTVVLTGAGATSITGTYPNFTISSTDTNTTYTDGDGIALTGTTFSVVAGSGLVQEASGLAHADTSSQASVDNSNGTVIQDITLDTFGHITAIGSLNLDDRYYTETESDSRFVNTSGDTMTGFLTLHADPTQALHATTKEYVDNVAAGLKAAPAVETATTSNLSANYSNGTLGVGATLTATTNGEFPAIDGVTVSVTTVGLNGVLIKNQTNSAHNGRYNLTQVGNASTPWILTRCGVCDQSSEIPGGYVFVKAGTAQAGTGWVAYVTNPSTFTVGTDNIIYFQFSGAGTYTAGSGLTLTGTQFSHTDTSSVANVDNSGNTFIQDLTFDTFGHVTGVVSAAVSIPGTNIAEGTRTTTTVPITSSTGTGATLSAATTSLAGVMTSADKTKLDGIATGATANTGTVTGVTATAPVASTGGTAPVISMAAASSGVDGYMTGAYATKLDGIAAGATANTGTVTGVTGTAPVVSSGGTSPAISMAAASSGVNGYMTGAYATKLDGIAAGATANTGTVTSVDTTGTVSGLTLTGGPITTTGTITLGGTLAVLPGNFASQTANTVLAAPNGSAGTPTFRLLVAADIPALNQSTTGTASAVVNTVAGTGSIELVRGNMGDNDQARILVGAAATNEGFLEIATADDGTEPIYVRQYTGVFTSLQRTATLLDGSGNTSFPGSVTANGATLTGNTGTVTGVTGTAPVVSSGGTAPAISMAAASSGVNGYMTGAYATKLDGIASGATNVTNNNQLTNGAGYITGYTETDTLATVTGRGASTSTSVTLSGGGNQFSGHFYFLPYDSAGNHYPHFNDGANNSGSKINWRLFTGGTNSVTHTWTTALATFATNVTVQGTLSATSKSFLIPHPTKPGMQLRYGSLEGPENGVYIRGKLKGKNKIELPEYWTKLVDPDSITVTLTPIGKHQKLYVEDIADNVVTVANDGLFAGEINCFFVVYGERVDIDKLVVESE